MFCCHSIINSRYLEAKKKTVEKTILQIIGNDTFHVYDLLDLFGFCYISIFRKIENNNSMNNSITNRQTYIEHHMHCGIHWLRCSFEMWKKHAYRKKKVNNEMEYNAIILLDSISYEATAAFNWATSISLRMCIYCVWTHLYNSWWHWTSAIEIWEHPNKKMHLI